MWKSAFAGDGPRGQFALCSLCRVIWVLQAVCPRRFTPSKIIERAPRRGRRISNLHHDELTYLDDPNVPCGLIHVHPNADAGQEHHKVGPGMRAVASRTAPAPIPPLASPSANSFHPPVLRATWKALAGATTVTMSSSGFTLTAADSPIPPTRLVNSSTSSLLQLRAIATILIAPPKISTGSYLTVSAPHDLGRGFPGCRPCPCWILHPS